MPIAHSFEWKRMSQQLGKSKKSRPERPEQHETDTAAQRIFQSTLPPQWVARPQDRPDYHVDYVVEPFPGGTASGLLIGVQLKGAKRLKSDGSRISFAMKTRDLKYYVKRDDPIFLVVVDVTHRNCYYVFLQQFISDHLAQGWRQKKSNVVHIPLANDLSQIGQFKRAAVAARKHMNSIRPGCLEAALIARKRKLESIDPRIEVAIRAATACIGSTDIGIHLNVREPFEFELIIKGDPEQANAQMRDLIERGVPIALNPADLDFEGAPLLRHLVEEALQEDAGAIKLHACRSFDASLVIRAIDLHDSIKLQIGIPAKGEGGTTELRIHAGLPISPMEIDFVWFMRDGLLTPAPTFHYRFVLSRWCGKPLRQLPYFDQLRSLLGGIAEGFDLEINCLVQGNKLFGGRIPNRDLKSECNKVLPYLRLYQKAREIAEFLNAEPMMPFDLTVENLREFEDIHWRLLQRSITPESMRIGCTIPRDQLERFAEDSQMGIQAPAILRFENEVVRFFDKSYSVGPAEYTITNTKILETRKELMARAASISEDEPIPFHLAATPETRATAKRLSRQRPKEVANESQG